MHMAGGRLPDCNIPRLAGAGKRPAHRQQRDELNEHRREETPHRATHRTGPFHQEQIIDFARRVYSDSLAATRWTFTSVTCRRIEGRRQGDLLPSWREFLVGCSSIQQDSVVKDFLYRRLQNLLDRQLVQRDGHRYKLTKRGEDYLATLTASLPDGGQRRTRELLTAVETHHRAQRDLFRERLE